MSAVYAETSAILAWLLGESNASVTVGVLNNAGEIVTSALTEVEVRRALVRISSEGMLSEAATTHLLGIFEATWRAWSVMEITAAVRTRASMRYPVEPVRSLDAIHLATALEFTKVVATLGVLSFDTRITDNLDPLGLEPAV